MQRMDFLDSTNPKIVFKKKNYRPWISPIQKDTAVLFENSKELSDFGSDRLLIGGFSFPKMSNIPYETEQSQKSNIPTDKPKSKAQEIQTLSPNVEIITALTQAENIELARKKEALARKAAEEKALCAMQQLHLTESELQNAKQQLQIEKQLKTNEASIKKSLEAEVKNALNTIENNEDTIAREVEIRRMAEEKLNETLSFLSKKEHHFRLKAEKTIKNNLRDFIEKEKNLEKTFENRIIALQAEHTKQKLDIQIEANKKVSEVIERERNIEKKFTGYANNLQDEYKERTLKIKADTAKQIVEIEEEVRLHEKIKIEAQQHLQKSQEVCRLITIQKTDLEDNLARTIQNAVNQKAQHESTVNDLREQIRQSEETISSISIINVELKEQLSEVFSKLNTVHQTKKNTAKQMVSLNLQIQQLEEKAISLENDKNELNKVLTDSLGKSKILQSITSNERKLRILLEEKLNARELGRMNHNKKLFEKKILELEEEIGMLEFEKAKSQENHKNSLDAIHKIEASLMGEKAEKKSIEENNKLLTEQIYSLEYAKQKEINGKETAIHKVSELVAKQQHLEQEKSTLEEKNKLLTEQIYSLEHAKQKEMNGKETAIHKVSELVAKQQHLEQEKTDLEEKYNVLTTKSVEFKIMLASEQALRQESERLKIIEDQARKVVQEKMHADFEQANNTVLTVLDKYTTAKEENKLLTEQIYSLEQAKQKEINEKETATHKVSELVAKQECLKQEKTNLEEEYNTLATRTAELKIILESEKCLRKEAERLKTLEESTRKAEQEKISTAMAQANKTILTVLGNYTTT